jgi:hypothetical protein
MRVSLVLGSSSKTVRCYVGDPVFDYELRDRFDACLGDYATTTPHRWRVTASGELAATELVFSVTPTCAQVTGPGSESLTLRATTMKVRMVLSPIALPLGT